MKIDRIALTEFRRFRETLVLDGLDAGLNLFVGENEAGKSTVAAALRAAFLERSRTRTVTDFAPWGVSGARPSVEVDFHIGDTRYRLSKHFLQRSRCELLIGERERLEGEAAEDALAALLGFEFSGKGQSQAKQAGVPGLLWIRQGEGQELADPAAHAGVHLRDALTTLSGEMASSDGDRLFARASAEQAELLDARGSRPKGIYRQAEEALADANARAGALQVEQAQLDADVDRLTRLTQAHDEAEREQPWKQHESKAEAARQKLAEIAKARDAAQALRDQQGQVEALLATQLAEVRSDQDEEDKVKALAREAGARDLSAQTAAQALAAARAAHTQSVTELEHAQKRHVAALALAERRDLDEQLARWQVEAARLSTALDQTGQLQRAIEQLQIALSRSRWTLADLEALRAADRTLAELLIRQDAAATRLRYRFDAGKAFRLDAGVRTDDAAWASSGTGSDGDAGGQTAADASPTDADLLSGEGERLLTAAAELVLPGWGRLRIEPGGRDLPELMRAIDTGRRERDRLLHRIGVESLARAEAMWSSREQAQRELDAKRKELSIHAPAGVDALRTALSEGSLRRQILEARRQAALAETDDASGVSGAAELSAADVPRLTGAEPELPTVEQAAKAMRAAQARVDQAAKAVSHAENHHNAEAAQAQSLQMRAQAAAEVHADPGRQQARQARNARVVETRSRGEDLRRRGDAAQAALSAHQTELVEQDLQRFERSAAIARESHQARHNEILTVKGKLEQAGARGIGEDLSQALADVERLARRRDEIALRARGLTLLCTLLSEQRDAATLRLQAPLARRLNHYLALLFPGARLRLGDDLLPEDLQRADQIDALSNLSFGTREQLGLLVRFAYADLLKEAGRPTLLILDDALVHADEDRRDLMKRALFDAASRHQILMFTCHAQAWRDLGVAQRSLG